MMKRNKPWEQVSAGTSSNELLHSLQKQSTGLESSPVDPDTANKLAEQRELAVAAGTATTTTATTTNALAGAGAGLGSLGSSYGSYGGMGGYGGLGLGMGGMGSMLGGYGGGMYGRYGAMGMGGAMGGEEGSSFFRSIQFMESMSFVIHSMCEVVRMLESNTEGIINLWSSLVNLIKRFKDWIVDMAAGARDSFFLLLFKFLVFLRIEKNARADLAEHEKEEAGLTEEERTQLLRIRRKKRIYKHLMRAMIVVVAGCLYYFYVKGRLITRTINVPSPTDVAATGTEAAISGGDLQNFENLFKA